MHKEHMSGIILCMQGSGTGSQVYDKWSYWMDRCLNAQQFYWSLYMLSTRCSGISLRTLSMFTNKVVGFILIYERLSISFANFRRECRFISEISPQFKHWEYSPNLQAKNTCWWD